MRYLLDTNIVSDLVRNPHGNVAQHIRKVGEAQVCTSIIVAAELRYGATKKGSPRLSAQLEAVLGRLKSCPSRCRPMLPTDCCVRDLRRLADQSAPMTCSLRLRRLLLVAPSSPIRKRNSPTSGTFDGRIGCDKPGSTSIGQEPCFGFTRSLTARVARILSPQTHHVSLKQR